MRIEKVEPGPFKSVDAFAPGQVVTGVGGLLWLVIEASDQKRVLSLPECALQAVGCGLFAAVDAKLVVGPGVK